MRTDFWDAQGEAPLQPNALRGTGRLQPAPPGPHDVHGSWRRTPVSGTRRWPPVLFLTRSIPGVQPHPARHVPAIRFRPAIAGAEPEASNARRVRSIDLNGSRLGQRLPTRGRRHGAPLAGASLWATVTRRATSRPATLGAARKPRQGGRRDTARCPRRHCAWALLPHVEFLSLAVACEPSVEIGALGKIEEGLSERLQFGGVQGGNTPLGQAGQRPQKTA